MTTTYSHCLYSNPLKMLTHADAILRALSRRENLDFGRYDIHRGGGTTLAELRFSRTGSVTMEGTAAPKTIQVSEIDEDFRNVLDAWIAYTDAERRGHTFRDARNSGLTEEEASRFADAALKLAKAEALREEAVDALDAIIVAATQKEDARLLSRMADHLPPSSDHRDMLNTLSARMRAYESSTGA